VHYFFHSRPKIRVKQPDIRGCRRELTTPLLISYDHFQFTSWTRDGDDHERM